MYRNMSICYIRQHIRILMPPLHMTGGVGSFGILTEEMGCFVRPVNNLRASHSRDVFEGLRDKKISLHPLFKMYRQQITVISDSKLNSQVSSAQEDLKGHCGRLRAPSIGKKTDCR